jgi:predicted phosphodiesterase
MRIGLLSDCEGNIAALEAGIRALKAHAPDVLVHAGDVLNCPFSPDPPAETIALLRSEAIRTVAGNHDRYLCDWGTARWPQTLWMRLRRSDPLGAWIDDVPAGQQQIAPADLAWLRALPEEILLADGVYVCHGMPGNPWNSIWPRDRHYDGNVSDYDRHASLRMLTRLDVSLVLCGHVPQPWEYRDQLPDDRELYVVRAGSRSDNRVGYAVITQNPAGWDATWGDAKYTPRHR